jgi:hypothetical protein
VKRVRHCQPPFLRIALTGIALILILSASAQDDEDYIIDGTTKEAPAFEPHDDQPPRLYNRDLDTQQVKKWKAEDDFWYANQDWEKPAEIQNEYVPIAKRTWFQTLLWLLIIGGFMGVLFWFLSENRVGLFNRKTKVVGQEQEEGIPEDIFAINYQKEIDNALRQENYRLAVRLMFLRLLKTMSERNVIRYKQEKTNLDYLFEVQPTAYYNHFFRAVRNYDYSWYGLFPVSREAYDRIKIDFDLLDKQLYRQ